MVAHEDMIEAFGAEGLLLLDDDQLRAIGLSESDTQILSTVGLPIRADQAFTVLAPDEPAVGAPVVFRTGQDEDEVAVLILGGPSGGSEMRYFLDPRNGVVGLLSLEGAPQAETVNSSVENFVEFLYRLRVRQQAMLDEASDDGRREYTEKLWSSLCELDPRAFDSAESWWSMVLDTLLDRTYIIETRALLQQRRAETADLSNADLPPLFERVSENRLSDRDRFDRALGRLQEEGAEVVSPEDLASDGQGRYGLLAPPADLADRFDTDGALRTDIAISWQGMLTARIQGVFACAGLVLWVSEQASSAKNEVDGLIGLDADELRKHARNAMDRLVAAANGSDAPGGGTVICLSSGGPSDLCRLAAAFGRLGRHGYLAEPALWPTVSGAWEQVRVRAEDGEIAGAVFWTNPQHEACFDARGDLVDELAIQWVGDRDLIARTLAGTGLHVTTPDSTDTTFLVRPAG